MGQYMYPLHLSSYAQNSSLSEVNEELSLALSRDWLFSMQKRAKVKNISFNFAFSFFFKSSLNLKRCQGFHETEYI